MRIISGEFRGRRLQTPGNSAAIRPTSDRAREALFNIIQPCLANAMVLDLFAGTGALGLEALSRGARQLVAIDNGHLAAKLLQSNSRLCGCQQRVTFIRRSLSPAVDFIAGLGHDPYDLVFIDPPYGKGLALPLLTFFGGRPQLLADQAQLIVEEAKQVSLPEQSGALCLRQTRRYGASSFWFYQAE